MTFIKSEDIYNVKIDLFQINAVLLNFLFVKIFWSIKQYDCFQRTGVN